jgi:hypothetical protein
MAFFLFISEPVSPPSGCGLDAVPVSLPYHCCYDQIGVPLSIHCPKLVLDFLQLVAPLKLWTFSLIVLV